MSSTEFFEIRRMNKMEPLVRDTLVELMVEYADSQDYEIPETRDLDDRIVTYANTPNACLLVAYNEHYGGAIGYILGHWFEEGSERIATIKEFYLVERARKKGIPRNYLRRFIKWAEENECTGVQFKVATKAAPNVGGLVSILEHTGFEQLYRVYGLDLTDAGGESHG